MLQRLLYRVYCTVNLSVNNYRSNSTLGLKVLSFFSLKNLF